MASEGRVTSFDVARAAGVSQSTVSRALRNDPNIGSRTVKKVLEAAAALHYVPSSRARALSTGATNRVAMVIDLDNPLWPLLVGRMHDELAGHGYELGLVASHGERDVETQLADGSVDGVIVSASRLASTLPDTLRGRGIPVVLVQRHSSDPDVDAAVADDAEGGAAAARMLLEAGHERIGALFGPADTSTGREREAGFRRVLTEAGVDLPDRWVRYGGFEMSHGFRSLAEVTGGRTAPTALFCANDTIAIGALNAAHAAGLRVPRDVALVGFDDIETASWPLVELSTIRVPFDEMLRSAVSLLLERIGGFTGLGRRVVHPVVPVPRSTHLRP
ncbi:LacI family transcriptional regulator [Actinoplanes bogorensis]|uniref:LacI family transcriptional regulator n=1 Tax=Paractinoplanes bogorensis TaxID=1610840 RepID=A0ABS5YXH0_9ACTN|nr:LacI family DNA-binding transcriptional regulator [Actinoplanes bogorensis]MBU2668122.1 LacI family transcriptional regulator [Actinoplanes bogorensis]